MLCSIYTNLGNQPLLGDQILSKYHTIFSIDKNGKDIFSRHFFLLYIELSLKPFKFSRQVEERSREQINEDSEEEEEDTVNNVALASTTSTEVDAQAIEVKILFCLFS